MNWPKVINWIKSYSPYVVLFILIIVTLLTVTSQLDKIVNKLNFDFDSQRELTEYKFEQLTEQLVQSRTLQVESTDALYTAMQQSIADYKELKQQLDNLDLEPIIVTRTTGIVQGETIVIELNDLDHIPRELIFRTEDGMPVAWYEITEADDSVAMVTGVYDFIVSIDTVIAQGEDDSPAVFQEATIASSANPDEEFPIEINSSVSQFVDPDPRELDWWDPHIDIGAIVGANLSGEADFGGTLGLSIMSYGNSESEIIRILRLSGDISSNAIRPALSPVGINIGDILPILEDTWLYPTVGYSINDQEIYLGITISSTL